MNLKQIKEIEEARKEADLVGSELSKLILDRKKFMEANAIKDFREYFTGNEFTVKSFQGKHTANFNNLTVELSLPNVETPYIGSYSVYDLRVKDVNYSVIINDEGRYPRVTSAISSAPRTEDERFELEMNKIADVKKDYEHSIANFEDTKWSYGLTKKEDKLGKYPQYATFRTLLETLQY